MMTNFFQASLISLLSIIQPDLLEPPPPKRVNPSEPPHPIGGYIVLPGKIRLGWKCLDKGEKIC